MVCFICGSTIELRPLTIEDVDGDYALWLNDQDLTVYNSHGRFPQTKESLKQYVNNANSSDKILLLAVIDITTRKHIGNISLQQISWIDRSAEIAFLLGNKIFWGKGIMYEAGKLLLHHGFKCLNLHRIYCGTSIENKGMQRLAAKLKMQQEGLRKEALYKNGKYCDIIEYGLLSKEYDSEDFGLS